MALLPQSSPLLPSPLGDSPCPSSAPLPSLCPNPCGEHASHPVGTQGPSSLYSRSADRENASLLCLHRGYWSVRGREELPYFSRRLAASSAERWSWAMALLWGCLALKPTMSHKSKSLTVPVPHWPGSPCAQVCTDVFSWQVQPAQAWPVQHISQQFHHVFSPSWPGTWQAQTAPTEQHEPILNPATRCTWRQVSRRPGSTQLTPSRFTVST